MHMKRVCLGFLAAILQTGYAQSEAADVCAMTAPPSGSLVRETHGVTLRTYPAKLPPNYTGCRATWLGDGHRLLLVRVESGAVRAAEIQEPNQAPTLCEFDANGALIKGDRTDCRSPEAYIR